MIRICAVVGSILTTAFAFAHSWYPGRCCSDNDCVPLAPGAVQRTDGGWLIVGTGEFVPDSKSEIGQDGSFHVCRYPGTTIICFFTPTGGV